jgi:WD repeat-containing protein 70
LEKDGEDEDDEEEPGPPPPQEAGPSSAEPEYDPREEFPDDDTPTFPTTHSLTLASHTKPVSALTLDPSGARVLSGAHDYEVKLWDFGGMSWEGNGVRPFKSWEPAGSYHVCSHRYVVLLCDTDWLLHLSRYMT